jgi:hypothetical protein
MPDYTVDQRGWRPPQRRFDGPAKPGFVGVLQAEHNLHVALRVVPTALNLRRIVDSQRQLSHQLGQLAAPVAPSHGQRWLARAQVYDELARHLRNLGGLLGRGGTAASDGAIAVRRLDDLSPNEAPGARVIVGFSRVFEAVDARLADIVESGMRDRRLFERFHLNALDPGGALVHRRGERFGDISPRTRTEVLATLECLRPRSSPPLGDDVVTPDRVGLTTTLANQSVRRAPGSSLAI